ncbi:MAG: hypothetical protein MK180_08100 [Rhodobacteraceae bacterium]|nr:hypothetical protein [Paracoccaceae bacterium]
MVTKTLTTILALAALPATAADLSLIVDRSDRGVELFIKFDTEKTEDLLAPYPDGFLADDGRVDIGPFRDGTADHGDALWSAVKTQIGAEQPLVEAMSMMVHPDELPVNFNDPIDGWIAMAVCNVTDPDARFDLGVLSTYAGFIAWDVAGHEEVSLQFPAAMEIEVVEFLEGRKIDARTVALAENEALVLDEVTTWERWRFW